MNNREILFEKDMLYPTDSSIELGCIHIQVLNPDNKAKIPVIIEDKSSRDPLKHIDSIIRLMQTDIFDRILVDIKKNVDIYIRNADTGIYVKIRKAGDKTVSEPVEL